jgi:FAD synthase
MNKYLTTTCSITKKNCDGGCKTCQTAINHETEERKKEKIGYEFGHEIRINGKVYPRNNRDTIVKSPISDLEIIKNYFCKDGSEYTAFGDPVFSYNEYTEWHKMLQTLEKTPYVEKYIYKKNCPTILVCKDSIYIVGAITKQEE